MRHSYGNDPDFIIFHNNNTTTTILNNFGGKSTSVVNIVIQCGVDRFI